jgi:hypothetical protein
MSYDAAPASQRWCNAGSEARQTGGAFVVGMLDVFGWRVLHGAIALLFVGVLLVAFGSGFVIRRARKRAEIASKLG